MTGEEWAHLEQLFDDARQRPPAEREAWLAAACPDAALREQVLDMLATFDDDPGFLENTTNIAGAVAHAVAATLEGQRLGAYRVLGQIGQGGMGVVYEAVRDDDDFARRVAIKVLPAWSGTAAADRFRRERRLLAGLDHPGIARLIDSGATPGGSPYFVMEFVEGRPIDVWCRERALTLGDRVALVEHVSEAVAYAHQRLVVHRDIKPANILVTAEGQPKLLDFGVATVLSATGNAEGLTRAGQQSFTPEFASPEQLRGEPVTTASDVYSLGVLLYLLASGRRPYRLEGLSPLEVMRVVCEEDPPPPSAVAESHERQAVAGPLDAVILRALRKPPQERYAAVAALQADLAAWRQGLPVTAAPDPLARRVRRFVRRYRVTVGAAAAVVVALAAGGGIAAWQARVAALQRDRAERRLLQAQAFSRSLIFDVNEALSRVAGNTGPRRLLLERAVQFLDGLAADADDDEVLTSELVEGYRRLGRVQGGTSAANLGDRAAAGRSLRTAVQLAEGLLARDPNRRDWLELALDATNDLSAVLIRAGEEGGADVKRRRDELLTRLERLHGADPKAAVAIARGHGYIGSTLEGQQRHVDAEREYLAALDLVERAGPSPAAREQRTFVVKRLGATLQWLGRNGEAERRYRQALALDEQALEQDPANPALRYEVTVTQSNLGGVLATLGRMDESQATLQRALATRRALVEADPGDLLAAEGLATLLGRLSTFAYQSRRFDESAALNREKVAVRETVVAREGATPRTLSDRALARLELAMALAAQAEAGPGGTRQRLRAEASRVLSEAVASDYTAPSAQSAVSVDAFKRAHADLAARLERP